MKNLFAENLFTVSGILSADECRNLIDRGEEIGFQQAAVRTASGPKLIPGIRDNDRAEFTDPKLASVLWERCRQFVPPELDGGIAIGIDDNFRFYRYDPGQRFKRHKDGVVKQSPEVWSRLSCLFYLNAGFSGGETVFYSSEMVDGVRSEEYTITPQTGEALFFPHEMWHEGRTLITGRKYVLRSDLFYFFPMTENP